jgi:3-oxoadipate enol-lactonase
MSMTSTLVFLHGLGGSGRIWEKQRRHFEPLIDVLAWTAPGYGGRPLPDPLTFDTLSDALLADLDERGTGKAILVGHSLGGMLAQTVVARAPDRVAALGLISTSPAFGDPKGEFQQKFIRARLDPLDEGKSMAEIAVPATAAMIGENPDREAIALAEEALAATPETTYRAYIDLLGTFDARATLSSIACPTFIAVGEHDKASPPIVSEKMSQKVAGSHYEFFPTVGHMLPFEQPEAFNHALEAFLTRHGLIA